MILTIVLRKQVADQIAAIALVEYVRTKLTGQPDVSINAKTNDEIPAENPDP